MTEQEIEKIHADYCRHRKPDTRDRLIDIHRGLAVNFALRYTTPGFSADEAVAAAYRGLLVAIDRFVPGRSKFSTFAFWWIQKHVLRERAELKNLVKLPVGAVRKSRKVRQLRAQGLSDTEIGQHLKISATDVIELGHLHETSSAPVSLQQNSGGFDNGPEQTLHAASPCSGGGEEEQIVTRWVSCPDPSPNPREILEQKEAEALNPEHRLARALKKLTPRQQKIVAGRMATPAVSFVDLGRKTRMSPEGCRKLFMKSIAQLRTLMLKDHVKKVD